jgi:hypothetical protein
MPHASDVVKGEGVTQLSRAQNFGWERKVLAGATANLGINVHDNDNDNNPSSL